MRFITIQIIIASIFKRRIIEAMVYIEDKEVQIKQDIRLNSLLATINRLKSKDIILINVNQ